MAILDAEADSIPIMPERQDHLADLFETYSPAVHTFFRRRGYDSEESRDLTSETFLKAVKGRSGFRGDAKLRTWLLTIAANVWKNDLRSRQTGKRSAVRTVALDALPVEEEAPVETEGLPAVPSAPRSPLQDALAAERRRRLREAVESLPPRMRQCVKLRIDRGLKYREVAVLLQVSVDTVKTQLHQARQRLREELGEYFELDGEEES